MYEYDEDGTFLANTATTRQVRMMCGQIFNPHFNGTALDGIPIVFSQKLSRKLTIIIMNVSITNMNN